MRESRIKSTFGSDLKIFITAPTICCKLPSCEQSLIQAYNNKILNAIKPVTAINVLTEMTNPRAILSLPNSLALNRTMSPKSTNLIAKQETCVKPANVLAVHPQVDDNAALPALITALRRVVVSTTYKLPEKGSDASDRRNRCLL